MYEGPGMRQPGLGNNGASIDGRYLSAGSQTDSGNLMYTSCNWPSTHFLSVIVTYVICRLVW